MLSSIAFILLSFCGCFMSQTIVYDNFPTPIPVDVNANAIDIGGNPITQMGNYILLTSVNNGTVNVSSVSTILSSRTFRSEFPAYNSTTNATINALGWYWNITVLIYSANSTNQSYPVFNSLLYTQTVNQFIPWEPENNGSCTGHNWYSNGTCLPGISFVVTWTFPAAVTMPSNIIVGYSWNTQTGGFNPTGTNGPWITLYLGLASTVPSIGTNILTGTEFMNSTSPGNYNSPGVLGVYRVDYGWSPYTVLALINGTIILPSTTGQATTDVVTTAVATTAQATTAAVGQQTATVVVVMIPVAGVGVALIAMAIMFIYIYTNRAKYTAIKSYSRRESKSRR